jgi:nicotinamidase-related amidase
MLRYGKLDGRTIHLCVDMQDLFLLDTAWQVPWMARILPTICRLVEFRPEQTIFTRFIPVARPGMGVGSWKRYYERWAEMTLAGIGDKVALAAPLRVFVPPALVLDKHVYSPWSEGRLARHLSERDVDTVIASGGETDICVLATVLGAIDLGHRVVIATDALCSSADSTHDNIMMLYTSRFAEQVETATVDEILDAWIH